MTYDIYQHITSSMMCIDTIAALAIHEESLTIIDEERENQGMMSPSTEANDIVKANEKILLYINSISSKQKIVTPAQISKELGMSEIFIENILIANGFQED